MKTFINLKKSIFYVAVLVAMVGITSCDSDDDPQPLQLTDVDGTYEGYIKLSQEAEKRDNGNDLTVKPNFTAEVKDGKIVFDKFLVDEILIIIDGNEIGGKVIEDVEYTPYSVGFTSKLNAAQDSIFLTLESKPLEFKYTKVEGEGEGAVTTVNNVKATIKASENGNSYSSKRMVIDLICDEIFVNDKAFEPYITKYIHVEMLKK